ncbi:arsenite efflux pump ACR3 [Anopheles sinensis]|uniref:Arsenite efflux pump ACR3 n=1 Tax=Anopheles sinensis TaxID=74873 RepID=A0A084WGN0_ANOSI|nr:arsenite efflux pump ACR3 [Anopheles sinensis]
MSIPTDRTRRFWILHRDHDTSWSGPVHKVRPGYARVGAPMPGTVNHAPTVPSPQE